MIGLLFIAHLFAQVYAGGGAKPAPTPSPIAMSSPVPKGGITYTATTYYTTTPEWEKIKKASIKLNETIQSKCFSDFMSSRKLIQTQGRTPAQVATQIQALKGSVEIKMYFRSLAETSAIAYRQPPETAINLNRAKFTTTLSDCTWASTMAHETMHSLLNYDHSFEWNTQRSYSIPYSVGGADQAQGGSAFDRCCK